MQIPRSITIDLYGNILLVVPSMDDANDPALTDW
jgi:hypothetical protein